MGTCIWGMHMRHASCIWSMHIVACILWHAYGGRCRTSLTPSALIIGYPSDVLRRTIECTLPRVAL